MNAEEKKTYNKINEQRRYTGSFEKKITRLLMKAKNRAKKYNREFAITLKDFSPVSHCPLLGIPLNFSHRGRGAAPDSATIDRIDPSMGYVPGNVWVISFKANLIKSNATLGELEMIAANLQTRMGL